MVSSSALTREGIDDVIKEISDVYLLDSTIVYQYLRIAVAKSYQGVAPALIWDDMTVTVPHLKSGKLEFKNYVISDKKRGEISKHWEAYLVSLSRKGFIERLEAHFRAIHNITYARLLDVDNRAQIALFELYYKADIASRVVPSTYAQIRLRHRLEIPTKLELRRGVDYLVKIKSKAVLRSGKHYFDVSMGDRQIYMAIADKVAAQHKGMTGVDYRFRVVDFDLKKSAVLLHTQLKPSSSLVDSIERAFRQYGVAVRVGLAPYALKWLEELRELEKEAV